MRERALGQWVGGTARDKAAQILRDRILTGMLPAGTRIDFDAICEEFGTSRTPVREALLRLSYEGLVDVAPRSGIVVLGTTPEDTMHSFSLLATLSGKGAEWAAANASDADIDRLQAAARAVAEAGNEDLQRLVDANWAFHRAVNQTARSPRLLNLIRQTVHVVPTNFFEVFPDQEHHSLSEHDELIDAIASHRAEAARRLAEEHVEKAGQALAAWLREQAHREATEVTGTTSRR